MQTYMILSQCIQNLFHHNSLIYTSNFIEDGEKNDDDDILAIGVMKYTMSPI